MNLSDEAMLSRISRTIELSRFHYTHTRVIASQYTHTSLKDILMHFLNILSEPTVTPDV